MSGSLGFKFGSGLVEVSALATILGASSAEALTLGLKGAGGMAWAAMSSFGALHVVKAALSAAVPDWSRDSLGLGGTHVDSAIGVAIEIDTKTSLPKRREGLGDVRAVKVAFLPHSANKLRKTVANKVQSGDLEEGERQGRIEKAKAPVSFYVLDGFVSSILNLLPASSASDPLEIFQYLPNDETILTNSDCLWTDWITILLSAVKLIEVFTLLYLGGQHLWWITSLPWLVSFTGAVLLQIRGLGRDDLNIAQSDIIAGTLPSPLSPGREKKIVLGVPANSRRHLIWLVIWAILPAVVVSSVIGTFLLLPTQSAPVVYAWAAFQALWLLARLVIYYVTEGISYQTSAALPLRQSWKEASTSSRRRAINLLFAVSKQQVTIHPRGAAPYAHDRMSGLAVAGLFDVVQWELTDLIPLVSVPEDAGVLTPSGGGFKVPVDVVAVIGDTVLRTFAWAQGVTIDHSDTYDSVLIFIRIQGSLFAIPAAHVWCCECLGNTALRHRGSRHGSVCPEAKWISWIPVRDATVEKHDTKDLFVQLDSGKTLGRMTGTLLTSAELHRRLQIRTWKNISLSKVEEVMAILRTSRVAASVFKDVLKSAQN
ncbi:hypothetical protein BD410DRAFT_120589 [Rickenella mellea]|uniref:Uncharacterized protein n=1 Tax=Rickenella mellea TaxID=50990 RepID=A0A4Y7PJ88_9AGAM|nr:hypothetical protein BD410DRAFT_120589 [Rickenella mellea]